MPHLKVNLLLKMKDIAVVAKMLTYPHHLEEPQRFTTSPVKKMHPLILTQSHHAAEVLENHLQTGTQMPNFQFFLGG